MVRPQCLARRGDIGNRLGGEVLDRALGCALTIDKLVIRHAFTRQIITHQSVVFRRDPQAEPVGSPEGRGRRIEILDAIHIRPAARHRKDQIGMAEAHQREFLDLAIPIGELIADQIGARHPHMDAPRRQFTRDFPR